jgi:predicted phage terminase large subunit-like protein
VALKLEIEENPRLRQDYGDLRGQSDWSESEFTTRNNRKVLARGYRSKYRGLRFGPYRPDDATVDDWEDDDTAENPEQCTKRMNRIWKAIRPAMQRQKDGGYSLKYIGTPLTTDSVTWQLWKDETRQIVKDRIPIVDKHGKPTWPEVYTQTEIDAIRLDSGLTAWHSEYLLDPLPSGERDFREEWICYVEKLPRLVQPITYGAVDPSATSSGDPKAVITLTGDRAAMKIYTRHAFIRKASPKELCKAIHEQQEIYDCDYAIEENGLKDYLWEAVELYEKDHHVHLRLRPVHHGSEISKQNRIRKLQSPIERRLIAFQRGHSDQDELVKQLLAFPSKSVHDDGPDALEEAYQQIMRRMRGASTEQLEAEGERETAELSARYTNFEGY